MKKTTKIKAMLLALMMLLGLIAPLTATAQQTDGFFRGGYDNYDNRGDVTIPGNDESGISNYGIGETVPLGSGLLILTAVGAGYAISRRKRNLKHGATLLLVFAMLLGMTNCKKNVETISSAATEGVFITLNVDGDNSGSKVIVDPNYANPTTLQTYASVTFEEGDVIYVGNNGAYCGYLEYNSSTSQFEGTVNPTSEADYLHFYFMGNKGPANSEPTEAVSITNQTGEYPVISYARSKTLYNSEVSTYTAKLQNYCAIVKFTTTDLPQATVITITGMNNTVEVNFAANNAATATPTLDNNPYTFSKTGNGNITLHAESNTERWAILLPQDEEVTTATAFAFGYATNGAFTVPVITENMYYVGNTGTGISVSMAPMYFTINNSNTKVLFAPGNLRASNRTANSTSGWTWSFAPTQYSVIGNNTANNKVGNNVVTTAGTVDLFGWVGSSGSLAAYGINNNTDDTKYSSNTNDVLKTDWSVAANNANLDGHSDWYTLTNTEWNYLFTGRTTTSGVLYAKATVNSVCGVILLPDDWNTSYHSLSSTNTASANFTANVITLSDWVSDFEAHGAVFLPAAGYRGGNNGTTVNTANIGFYWSKTAFVPTWTTTDRMAYVVYFDGSNLYQSNDHRRIGCAVRLVRPVTVE